MFKKFLILNFIFGIIFLSLLNNKKIEAQIGPVDILMNVTPEYPKPNEEVRVTINSYSIDLNRANIVWSVNNQIRLIGVGKTSFSLNSGDVGFISTITANIETINGQNVSKSFTISPFNVDLIWEANNSYSPPFYKGKTLVSKEGEFKIVAIPNLRNLNSSEKGNMQFSWRKDGKNQIDASGWGSNYFIFKNNYLETGNNIEVFASNINNSINAINNIVLIPFQPKIVFYKRDKEGNILYQNALSGSIFLDREGGNILAIPYFFSPKEIKSKDLAFKWILNNREITRNDIREEISVIGDQAGGTASLILNITNKRTLFQEAEKRLLINF